MRKFSVVLTVLLACLLLTFSVAAQAGEITVGNGYSEETDPGKAGAEAAAKAKKALGGEAKVVLVFDQVGKTAEDKEKMLAGIASEFDSKIIFGCSSYAPITQDCNTGTVGVMALGGDISAVPAVSDIEGGHGECGKRIGKALKPAVPEKGGKVVLLWGSCHVNKNDALVKGVCEELGEKFPVAGGAASKGEFLYSEGKVLLKSNLGLLLTGDFECGFSAKKGDDLEGVIATAGEACEQAMDGGKGIVVLAFDCGGRRGTLKDSCAKELAAMKGAVDGAPIFGFYGSGETGPKDNDSAPQGVGHHVFICVISSK